MSTRTSADVVLSLRAQVKEARSALSKIASVLGCEPEDDDDLVEACRLLVRERDDALEAARFAESERYTMETWGIALTECRQELAKALAQLVTIRSHHGSESAERATGPCGAELRC